MNKKELVDQVAGTTGLTKKDVDKVVDAITGTISCMLSGNDKVILAGFGTFDVAHRKARKGRNPQTGEDIQIPAKRVPKFRPGKRLREKVK